MLYTAKITKRTPITECCKYTIYWFFDYFKPYLTNVTTQFHKP